MSPNFIDGVFGIWVMAFFVEIILYIVNTPMMVKGAEKTGDMGKYADKAIASLLWFVFYRGVPLMMISNLLRVLWDEGFLG